MSLCRLCGEEKSPLDISIELNDKKGTNWTYLELIEFHSRVSLKTNKLLPQGICDECRTQIDSFIEFSHKLEAIQSTFDAPEVIDEDFLLTDSKGCFVHLENIVEAIEPADENEDQIDTVDWIVSEILVTRKPNKTSENQNVADIFKDNNSIDFIPKVLPFEVPDTERLGTGEISEEFIERKNILVWSDLMNSCEVCYAPMKNLLELKSHHESNHNAKEVQISCSACTKNFKTILGLMNHTEKHNDQEHLTHCCIVCNKVFLNLRQLNEHQNNVHPDEAKLTFQCLICGLFKESLTAVERHCKSSHMKIEEVLSKRRTTFHSEASNQSKRIKTKDEDFENEASSSSESNNIEEMSSDDDDKPLIDRVKKESTKSSTSKKSVLPTKPLSKYYGPEIDSFEKLFADELNGTSKFPVKIHLNIDESCQMEDGEIPEEFASKLSTVRWSEALKCAVCQKKFANMSSFFDHNELKHGMRNKLYDCTFCESKFKSYSVMINHHAERHFLEHLKLCCLICSKMFYNLPTLIDHFNSHGANFKLFICLVCSYYTKSLDDLKEHKAFHMLDEKTGNRHICDMVYESFKLGTATQCRNSCVADFERNGDGSIKEEHQKRFQVNWNFATYHCPPCELTYEHPFELFLHQRAVHQKQVIKKSYNCSLCADNKDFANVYSFVNHAYLKHFDDGKFTCIVCNKAFWNLVALATHYYDVHPAFSCILCCHCGKIFMHITSAAAHFKTLNFLKTPGERTLLDEGRLQDEMNHICHVCAKSFRSRGALYSHEKTHNEMDRTEIRQCHICNKFYKNKYKLAQHMVAHEDSRSFKCKACGQAFNYKKLLQRHIQAVHDNDRPHGCTFCDKRFNSKYDLIVHTRLHTGDYPYECPVEDCDLKYPAWSNLFKHCQSRHKLDIRSEGYKKLKATQKTPKLTRVD